MNLITEIPLNTKKRSNGNAFTHVTHICVIEHEGSHYLAYRLVVGVDLPLLGGLFGQEACVSREEYKVIDAGEGRTCVFQDAQKAALFAATFAASYAEE